MKNETISKLGHITSEKGSGVILPLPKAHMFEVVRTIIFDKKIQGTIYGITSDKHDFFYSIIDDDGMKYSGIPESKISIIESSIGLELPNQIDSLIKDLDSLSRDKIKKELSLIRSSAIEDQRWRRQKEIDNARMSESLYKAQEVLSPEVYEQFFKDHD